MLFPLAARVRNQTIWANATFTPGLSVPMYAEETSTVPALAAKALGTGVVPGPNTAGRESASGSLERK